MGRQPPRGLRNALQPASSEASPIDVSFDFVVAERPKYVPNSGPPLAPLTLLPVHDKDGIILESIILSERLRYVVGYEDSPHLRIAVRPQNILDWVSPRTYERYGTEQSRIQEKLRREEEMRIAKAREERRIRKELKRAEKGTESRGIEIGKKRKRSPKPEGSRKLGRPNQPGPGTPRKSFGPGRHRQMKEETLFFKSPRRPSLHSQQQPSLSHPSRGLAEKTVPESESEDELALETAPVRQLNAGSGRFNISMSPSVSKTASPETPNIAPTPKQTTSNRNRVQLESPSLAAKRGPARKELANSFAPASPLGGHAGISSREARVIYEDLERQSMAKNSSKSISRTTSASAMSASPSRNKQRSPIVVPANREATAVIESLLDDDGEYEVRAILDDQIRVIDGKPYVFYLIKWVGLWDDTWEPAGNVGSESIAQYEKDKARARTLGLDVAKNRNGGDRVHEMAALGRGRGNQRVSDGLWQRGEVVNEGRDNEVDLL